MGACESCQEKRALQASELAWSAVEVQVPVKPKEPLHVMIVSARGLGGGSWFPNGDMSLYCTLSVREKPEVGVVNKTKRVRDSPAPRWQEEIVFTEYEVGDTLQFEVVESLAGGRDETVGRVELPNERFKSQGFNGELELGSVSDDVRSFLKIKVRLANEQYPEGTPEDFSISFDNPSQTILGIDYDMQDGATVHVTALRPGPGLIRNYNENVKPAFQLQPGDFIVEVNSVKGNALKILDTMRRDVHVEMLVRRPEEIYVALLIPDEEDTRKGRDRKSTCSCGPSVELKRKHILGLEFPRDPVGNALVITKVNEGPIEEWNHTYPHQQIKTGYRIVEVNHEKGTADVLHKRLQAARERVQLTVIRPMMPDPVENEGKREQGFHAD